MAEEHQCPNLMAALSRKFMSPAQMEVRYFYFACPAFVDNIENWHILAAFLPEELESERKWPTTEQLIAAYHLARENGHFQPN